jgi:hypothetical protein
MYKILSLDKIFFTFVRRFTLGKIDQKMKVSAHNHYRLTMHSHGQRQHRTLPMI